MIIVQSSLGRSENLHSRIPAIFLHYLTPEQKLKASPQDLLAILIIGWMNASLMQILGRNQCLPEAGSGLG